MPSRKSPGELNKKSFIRKFASFSTLYLTANLILLGEIPIAPDVCFGPCLRAARKRKRSDSLHLHIAASLAIFARPALFTFNQFQMRYDILQKARVYRRAYFPVFACK